MHPWQETAFEDDSWHPWRIGPLSLWGRRRNDEVHLVSALDAEEPAPGAAPATPEADPPPETTPRRWILRDEPLKLALSPVMPDRPVVVRPEAPVRFPPGRKARIYVSIPAWVRVSAVQRDRVPLCDEPTRELSSIWFGDLTDGVLAYSLQITARRRLEEVPVHPHRAICPVTITNASAEELDFQRLCIRVEHLTVYARGDDLWTNLVRVRFRGPSDASQIEYVPGAPETATGASLVGEARQPVRRSLIGRSFGGLFKLPGA